MANKYKIREIVDFNQLESLLINFNKICFFPILILDDSEDLLMKIGWLDTCKYLNNEENNCINECKVIASNLHNQYLSFPEGKPYKCIGGFDNIAYPIIIDNSYYGCFITGKFQVIESNEIITFDNQSKEKERFNVSEEQINDYLNFVKNLIDMLAEIGIKEIHQKEIIENAKKSELINQTIVENSNDGFWIIDKDAKITHVNERYLEMSGYIREEILDMHIFQLDVQERKQDFNQRVDEIKDDGSKIFETKHRRKNGTIFNVEVNAFPSINPNELYAFIRDITDRKQIEHDLEKQQLMLSTVLNTIPESVFWKDLHGNYLGCNTAFAEGAGFVIPAQIIGKNDYQLPWSQFADIYRADDFKVMKSREPKYNIIEEIINSDGRKQWINTTKVPLINEMNEVFGVLGIYSDVTEKKKAEEAIIESEKQLREAQKLAQIGHWELNIENMDLYWSDEIYHIFEIDKNEFGASYSAFLDAIHPDDRDMVNEAYTKSIENKTPYEITHRLLMKSGEIKYVNERCRTEYLYDTPIRSLGTVQDITALVLSEEQLKKTEVQLTTALEMAKLGHWEYDIINDKFKFNDQFYKLFKTSYAEVGTYFLSMNDYLKRFVHPDDINFVVNETQNLNRDLENFQARKLQHRFLFPNGEVGYLSVLYYLLKDINGKVTRSYGINQDITDIIKSQEALRKNEFLLSESQKLAFIGHYDLNFSTQKWESSESLNLIFGIDDSYATDIEGWLQLIHPEDKEMMNNYLMGLINEKQLNFDKTYRIIRFNDGEIRWVHGLGLISYTESGQPIRMYGNIQDITERILYEYELKEAKNKAEQSEKLKTSFLQNMSHEIRTPLNGIMGFSTLLKDYDDLSNDEISEYVDLILGSSSRLLNIVNDVLELSSIESGVAIVHKSIFNTNEIIQYLSPIYEKKAEIKNIDFEIFAESDCVHYNINTDKGKIIQILVNFLNNAFKFTSIGKVKLDLSVKNQNLIIKVIDTGVGIPSQYIDRIFDRFWQYEAFSNVKYGGTGLGLSISQKLSNMIGTTIEVESEENHGSTFSLIIPNDLLVYEKEKNIELPLENKKVDKENLSVLIVEDEETNYYYLASILKKMNIKPIWAHNGEKAIELIKNNKFDIVFMDLKMPIMDGYEAIQIIRQFNKTLPVIAQTAYSDLNDQLKAIEYGFNAFISKPYEPEAIINAIESNLLKGVK